MNELINLMYQIKDLSTRTNEIALIDLQPRLMAVYDKLEAEQLNLCGVSNRRELLETVINELDNQVGTNYSADKNLLNTIESGF
jgi:hypothetical protein